MRWTLFCLLCMGTTFLVGFIHQSGEPWTWAESLPFSTDRAFPVPVLFECFLCALIAVAIVALVSIRRWRLQQPEIPFGPVAPRDRVWMGLGKLTVFLVCILLAYWSSSHMDCGLRFKDVFVQTLGLSPNQLPNAAAVATLAVMLAALVGSVYMFWGTPRPVSNQPVVYAASPNPVQPPRPFPPYPPQGPRRP